MAMSVLHQTFLVTSCSYSSLKQPQEQDGHLGLTLRLIWSMSDKNRAMQVNEGKMDCLILIQADCDG